MAKRPNPLDDDVTPCWFCNDCMVLRSTNVNNNKARDIIIERIRPFCLSLMLSQAHVDQNQLNNNGEIAAGCPNPPTLIRKELF